MHALIIPSWYPSHSGDIRGSFFREQALALFKRGCKVGVIYPQFRSLRQWRKALFEKSGLEIESDQGMPTYRFHRTNWLPRMPNWAAHLWVREGLKIFESYVKDHGLPDVIHAHSLLNAGLLAKKIKERYGIPFVVTEHSTTYARNLVTPVRLSAAKDVASSADKLYAVSNEFCEVLTYKLGPENIWNFLPNIVNDAFLTIPLIDKSANFRFINVALADRKKQQSNIITAFTKAFENDLDVSLTIAGDGPELDRLRGMVTSLGLDGRVKLPGRLTRGEVIKAVSSSNAFVLSSQYETFGVVVIEALALGIPVVATRCGGPESIVRPQDGVLVPVGDVDALATAMRYVYDHQNQYDAEEIREACRARYSEEKVTSKLMEEYRTICRNSGDNQSCI